MIATSTQLKTHLAELQERSGMHHPDTYRAWNEYIDALVAEKQLDAAAAEFSALLTVQEQSYGEKSGETIPIRRRFAHFLYRAGDVRDAGTQFAVLQEVAAHNLGPEHLETLHAQEQVAQCLNRLGNVEGATQIFSRVYASRRHVQGKDHPDTLTSWAHYTVSLGKHRKRTRLNSRQ